MATSESRRKAMGVRVLPQHLTITGALLLALCLMGLLGAAGSKEAHALVGEYEPGQVIVKLDPKARATIRQINADYGTTTLDNTLGGMGVYLLQTPAKEDVKTFAERLARDPFGTLDRVLYAEPNFTAETAEGDARMRARGISPSSESPDPTDQYPDGALDVNLNLSCAATQNNQGKGVTVAVLDTGAQLNHPALKARFKDVKRYDFVDNDNNPSELWAGQDGDNDGDVDEMTGHGTHVAGIVVRVAPAAKIMPLRVLDTEGYGDVFTISKAIRYSWLNGGKVINLSLGSSNRSKLLEEMIGNAINKGVVVAAAAGNSNTTLPHYPAAGDGIPRFSEDGLVAVTSVGQDKLKSDFANYGTWVDVAAPGEGIRSAFPINQYANWDGTSMSTPFVSGQAALIKQVYGSSIKPENIGRKIRDTARPEDPVYSILGAKHTDVCESLR
jgi:subtilisin family serine protease